MRLQSGGPSPAPLRGRGPYCAQRCAPPRSPRRAAPRRERPGVGGRRWQVFSPCACRASRTPCEMLCQRWSSPSRCTSPVGAGQPAYRPHDADQVEVDPALGAAGRSSSASVSALVVSIWLVASRSSTSARVSGAASTFARIASCTGAAVTQNSGTSTRSTRTPGYVAARSVVTAYSAPGRLLAAAPSPSPPRPPGWSGTPARAGTRHREQQADSGPEGQHPDGGHRWPLRCRCGCFGVAA